MTEDLHLVEPVPIDDDVCTALALIEDVDWGVRLVFYADQTVYETGEIAHVVKRKIVVPTKAIPRGYQLVRGFLRRGRRAKRTTLILMK